MHGLHSRRNPPARLRRRARRPRWQSRVTGATRRVAVSCPARDPCGSARLGEDRRARPSRADHWSIGASWSAVIGARTVVLLDGSPRLQPRGPSHSGCRRSVRHRCARAGWDRHARGEGCGEPGPVTARRVEHNGLRRVCRGRPSRRNGVGGRGGAARWSGIPAIRSGPRGLGQTCDGHCCVADGRQEPLSAFAPHALLMRWDERLVSEIAAPSAQGFCRQVRVQ